MHATAAAARAAATRTLANATRVHARGMQSSRFQAAAAQSAASPAASAAAAAAKVLGRHPRIESTDSVIGELVSQNLDLSRASIGQSINPPYETTVGESQQCLWMSTFQVHDRLYTSTPFAQLLHLPQHVLPFYMVLFKAVSMGHVDENREVLDLGFANATYVRPAYPGDTLKQHFTIKHLKNTSNGESTIVTVGCELTNQRGQLIFSVDKSMLFPGVKQPPNKLSPPPKGTPTKPRSHLLSHILYNCDALPTTNSLALLREGQMLLHSSSRPIGANTNMQLSTLFRWTHPSIFNLKRYSEDEILVPGGLVLAATIAASSRGLFETLNESLESCTFLNKVSPVDLIGGVSYVHSIRPLKEGMEEVSVTTLGLKNVDVARELEGVALPRELFTMDMHRKQLEALVHEHVPQLAGKIVVKATRTISRQSPYAQQRSIPLL